MQIVNLGELINKMGKGEVISQDDIVDILGSFLKDADVGEVHVHNCSKCSNNVHCNNEDKKDKKNNIKSNIKSNISTDKVKPSSDDGLIMGSNLSNEDIALLNFANMYISAYRAGDNLEEYRKFFIDNVLPIPTLQGIAKYIK